MSRIKNLFSKKGKILSVYFTAGYPEINNTSKTIIDLVDSGVDMIEIGLPFSDPLADGPVIQQSSKIALQNGMNADVLFEQLKNIREKVNIPLIIMCYANTVIKYGFEKFCENADECGIDGLIIPDITLEQVENKYLQLAKKYNLQMIFLISPTSSAERITRMDNISDSFLYVVSSNSTTGKNGFSAEAEIYFQRIKNMNLKNPLMIGFGISDNKSFECVCKYASGAIVGSAFIKAQDSGNEFEFIKGIRKCNRELIPD